MKFSLTDNNGCGLDVRYNGDDDDDDDDDDERDNAIGKDIEYDIDGTRVRDVPVQFENDDELKSVWFADHSKGNKMKIQGKKLFTATNDSRSSVVLPFRAFLIFFHVR